MLPVLPIVRLVTVPGMAQCEDFQGAMDKPLQAAVQAGDVLHDAQLAAQQALLGDAGRQAEAADAEPAVHTILPEKLFFFTFAGLQTAADDSSEAGDTQLYDR